MAFSQLALDPAVNISRVPLEKAVENIHYARVADTVIASIRLGTSADHTTRLEVKEQVWAIRTQVLQAVQQGIISPVTDPNDAAVSIARDRAKVRLKAEMQRYYNGEVSLMGDQWETPASRMRDGDQDAPRVNPEDLVRDPASATPIDMMVVLKNLRLLPAPDAARILFLLAGKDENADATLARLPKATAPSHAHGFGYAVAQSVSKAVETIYIKGDVESLGADASKVDVNAIPKALAPFLPLYIKQAAKLLLEANNRKNEDAATKAQFRIKQVMDSAQAGNKNNKALTWALQKAAEINEQLKKVPPDGNVSVMGGNGDRMHWSTRASSQVAARSRQVKKAARKPAREAIQMDSGYSGGRMGALYDGMGADVYTDNFPRPDVTDPESTEHPLMYHVGPNTLPEYQEDAYEQEPDVGMGPRDIEEENEDGQIYMGSEAVPRTAWTQYQAKHNPSWRRASAGYGTASLDSVSGWANHWKRAGAAPAWNAMRGAGFNTHPGYFMGGFSQPSYFMQGSGFPSRYFMAGSGFSSGRAGGGGGPRRFSRGINRSPTGIPSNLSPVAAARVVNALVKNNDPRAPYIVKGLALQARTGNVLALAISSILSRVGSSTLTNQVKMTVAGLGDMLSGALVGADAMLNRRGGPAWA